MQIGYDPDFIGDGVRVPLPKTDAKLGKSVLEKKVLRDRRYSDHIHYTLVMNEHTKQLIYSAYNIDQNKLKPNPPGKGKRAWRKDPQIGKENQLGNEYYKDRKGPGGATIPNPYDRGHMVMRFNNMWGATNSESDKAGKATFVYANASLQHENLNRDEWRELELEIVRDFKLDSNGRLAVFTGPIFGDLDRHVILSDTDSARVPSGFFKVICFRNKEASTQAERLGVLTFGIFQDDQVLRDQKGRATVKLDRRYQITITELQELTGLRFDRKLFNRNPLFYFKDSARRSRKNVSRVPERIPFDRRTLIGPDNPRRRSLESLADRKIIINSAMIDPRGRESRGEWISLHNRGAGRANLNGWTLVDGQGREAMIRGSIGAGESLKLRGRGKGTIKLGNKGGSLLLFDRSNRVIDHVTWSAAEIRRQGQGVAFLFDPGR